MPLCISHQSAIEYWNVSFRLLGVGPGLGTWGTRRADTRAARAALSDGTPPHLSETNHRPRGCTVPVHALVTTDRARSRAGNVVEHVHSTEIPSAAIVRIDDEFFVSVPEFTFSQLADSLSLIELIRLGFELCGTYTVAPDGALHTDRPRLSTVAKLRQFVERVPGFRGRKRAMRALRYVLDGSASPRETELAMLLCLPYALGGYGLPRPKLNQRVDLLDRKGHRSGKYVVCDLYWPEHRLDVEYDSSQFHASEQALAKDSARRMALEGAGITSVNVTNAQMRDSGLFNQMARSVARLIGKRLRYRDPDFTRAHLELRRQLGLP